MREANERGSTELGVRGDVVAAVEPPSWLREGSGGHNYEKGTQEMHGHLLGGGMGSIIP